MRLIAPSTAGKIACLMFLVFIAISCNGEKSVKKSISDDPDMMAISGMDMISDSSFLAVYDLKSFEEGHRVGVIKLSENKGINVYPVPIANWQHADGKGSDLESVCSLPGQKNEFLIAESGKWDGRFGRMFHIRLYAAATNFKAEVLGLFDIPEFDSKGPDDDVGDEIEGIACLLTDSNDIMVLFGERGGSNAYKNGLIRWAQADLDTYELKWTTKGKVGVEINAPGHWTNDSLNRDISGLHLDEDNGLWAVASEELGENGPFNSIVFRIGMVQGSSKIPLNFLIQWLSIKE
jgi:hypothetical protein